MMKITHSGLKSIHFAWILALGLGSAMFLGSTFTAQGYYRQDNLIFETTCTAPFQSVATPLNDLDGNEYIRMDGQPTGAYGGLYPGGRNTPPDAHLSAGVTIAAGIVPLNLTGSPDPLGGKIVMISIGMSNTAQEFQAFRTLAYADPHINPQVLLVNGAQAGQTADLWVDPQAPTWDEVDRRLELANLSPAQVQVAWVKQTLAGGGNFPAWPLEVKDDLKSIVRNLKTRYPNLQMAYLSSRTRSYTYWNGLSPEPAAFESGFAVKWLIQDQINHDPALNFNPTRGAVLAPYLAWGPYLWADGSNPRSDGLVWLPEDMVPDCTHPSEAGQAKVAARLLAFFKSDPTTNWFLEQHFTYLPVITRP